MAAKTPVPESALAWPPTLSPYLAVADARRAIDWYTEVFDGHQRGEVHLMPDGAVGHAEVGIGDAVLMLAEGGAGGVPVVAPDSPTVFTHTLHVQVPDVDATFTRAVAGGATVERPPTDEDYGRVAVVVDPFGHRWLLNTPPARATRRSVGDVAYVTMVVTDAEAAKAFYAHVLGWSYHPGSTPGGWAVADHDGLGLYGAGPDATGQVQLCFRTDDIEAALDRVRERGGETGPVRRQPYGFIADCVDPLGAAFQLWEAAG
ncbi:VOC family protein [Actinokineospora iranica]|uniref:Uncharacterized conserved protein PhnB, glyoxalase superfamily n=1 Tax=Actinokineospora iranica TaxID=1271860 RepID=A0A1G6IQ71_9PSEU|nr:VOC family protein [Actinokineospora iranica]SDC08590.1 Uncharacterized conserved protein PhnB, glyoxalase superfamily [Actinokineospora iranica]